MKTLYVSHPAFLEHETPHGHPERADRLRAIEKMLTHPHFAHLRRCLAPKGSLEQAMLAHDAAYVAQIAARAPQQGHHHIDDDTVMSSGSLEATLYALGASCFAVDQVMNGAANSVFCALRPPGHHAQSNEAMGFCFFNNAAVAARYARKHHGLARVAIVDWDAHHGNGTQEIFWNDPSVFYASTHEYPAYPGTGQASEVGQGNILNCPLHAGDGSDAFRDAFAGEILPALERFSPQLLIISAGFDAHERDQLANLTLTEEDFGWATQALMRLAARHAQGRIVSLLEGGYDLTGLTRSVGAHLMVLMNDE